MKPAGYIALSVIALIIILGLQLYTVTRIYHLEMDRVENEYREIIRSGLDILEGRQSDMGLKTAYLALDYLSSEYLTYLQSGSVKDTTGFRNLVLQNVHHQFKEYQTLETVVENILRSSGISTGFSAHFVFNNYHLEQWPDTLTVLGSESFVSQGYPDTLGISDKSIYLGHYRYVGTNYSCAWDFLVDFSELQQTVIKSIRSVLIFVVLSLLIVGGIFILTLRNLFEERRLSELKTDFINNMTHELKTPLSTISIATRSLLKEQALEKEERIISTIQIIDRQNKYLSKQIHHLLEVSLWERHEFDYEKSPVRLKSLLAGIFESFQLECQSMDADFHLLLNLPDELEILADETQIARAVHNLLINAIKYSKERPYVQLTGEYANGEIRVGVKDQGIGISKDHRTRIFDKFYRVHTGNVHNVKGLGLGLFYVKQIIEAHQGSVTLNSKKGEGSEFIIKLPVYDKQKGSSG